MQTDALSSKERSQHKELCSSNFDTESDVCRDFLRNVCKRGKKCKYKHPVNSSSSETLDPTFCHDFQNGACHRASCKFIHCTKEAEEAYRSRGIFPSPTEKQSTDVNIPICKDFLNHNCRRGAQCKFRHGKPLPSQQAAVIQCPDLHMGHSAPQPSQLPLYQHQHITYPNNHQSLPVESSEPGTSAPETTAMVAAAAAAGYLVLQKQQQQRNATVMPQATGTHLQVGAAHYNAGVSSAAGPVQTTSLGGGALPPASAAAVAAAVAATALTAAAATASQQQHHRRQQQHQSVPSASGHLFPESQLAVTQTTNIPVMQSVMEAVSMQPASSRSNLSLGASTYPAVVNALPDRLAPSLTSTSGHQYSFQPPLPPTCPPTSSSAVLNGLPTPPISNGAYPHMPISNVVTTTSYLIPEQASPAVTSNNFSQHHQDANTAAAVAAAACFGAMLSQPVAAAASAASRGEMTTDRTDPHSGPQQSHRHHPHGGAPPPPSAASAAAAAPPSAVAAAAAAAVAAAVVSSASRSSQHHLPIVGAASSHPSTRVSFAPSCSTAIPVFSDGSADYATTHASIVDPMGVEENQQIMVCPPPEPCFGAFRPSLLAAGKEQHPQHSRTLLATQGTLIAPTATAPGSGLPSSAASAAYTATMTTAAAAAAMAAAAVAVEEHNQAKKKAMAALKENAVLMHVAPGLSTDDSFVNPTSSKGSSAAFLKAESLMDAPKTLSKRRTHLRALSKHQNHFGASAKATPSSEPLDIDDYEDYEEGYFDDFEMDDDVEETEDESVCLKKERNDNSHTGLKCSGLQSSLSGGDTSVCRPQTSAGKRPRQRSFSYPSFANTNGGRSLSTSQVRGGTPRRQRLASSPPSTCSMAAVPQATTSSPPPSANTSSKNASNLPSEPAFRIGRGKTASKRPRHGSKHTFLPPVSKSVRHRFVHRHHHGHLPRHIRQPVLEFDSEMDVDEDDVVDECCYRTGSDYFRPANVVPTPYRECLQSLKRENAELRLQLHRVVQQRNSLQLENHTLLRQNLKLRKMNGMSRRAGLSLPVNTSLTETSTTELQQSSAIRPIRRQDTLSKSTE